MVELEDHQLLFSFPEVHPDAKLRITFQRTLRIPDDDQTYPLPADLGRFPLDHVDDFQRAPEHWQTRGGVIMPMWQTEAAWIDLDSHYPMAIKIAAGKINAVTGEPWTNELTATPQDYLVTPDQLWLDGFCVGAGRIRQFVAMPLGEGFTAEEQINQLPEHGGLQIIAYPMRQSLYREIEYQEKRERQEWESCIRDEAAFLRAGQAEVGMASGGLMSQEIVADEHGIDAWDHTVFSRCFINLANAAHYKTITGLKPPQQPFTAQDYEAAGVPWFTYYDADREALSGSKILMGLDTVAAKLHKKGIALRHNEPITIGQTIELARPRDHARDQW